MQGQIRYVLRRNHNKQGKLRTVGDFNEWKSYLNLIKYVLRTKSDEGLISNKLDINTCENKDF